ncbi:CGP-CTERM sorting domain-containing protein [Thermococcus aciditolerans]|uniref:CGP-CTERM sorting domain-containing protein n=1 Tax=Thermococcus aciditolerans TaxID=2598455 RepID=A0A5C0SHQ5_9EURY|nr:CGP-CTERM sorting domain-containing protein [Thermococcus aciditolerans]QEK13983.1 CGP-CTERM sorting domain-containing protein [Thermococcus aciditolerans]
MRKAAIILAVFVFFGVFGFAMASATTVGVDLAHGESDKGLAVLTDKDGNVLAEGMVKTISDVSWAYIGPAEKADELGIKQLGDKITYDAIKDVDFLILGQPTQAFSPDEVQAIVQWWNDGNRILWVAGDSDYGDGPQRIDFVDTILDAIGANLRLDQCSAEDATSNAGAGYRVIGLVNPDSGTPDKDMLTKDFKNGGKVLFHGPGVVAYVDDNGNWQSLHGGIADGIYIIVTTSADGQIVENTDPAAQAYTAGDTGEFPLMAVQLFEDKKNVLVVSGETPYGGYEPMWSPTYHGVDLDGPQFVTNFIHWAISVQQNLGQTETSEGGSTCGPAALIGLALIPLALYRRRK